MPHGTQTQEAIYESISGGALGYQQGVDALVHLFSGIGFQDPLASARAGAKTAYEEGLNRIVEGTEGTRAGSGLPIIDYDALDQEDDVRRGRWRVDGDDGDDGDDEEDRADRGREGDTAFSAKDIADAIEALTGTPTGRRNIFERERAPSGINPILANIQRSRFDPLNAEFILNQAGNLATAPQDSATFIKGRTPINAVGGFGTFGQQDPSGTGRLAGTGLLGGVQNLFSMATPDLEQVGAREALEQAARRDPGSTGNILSQIASSGISPMFRGFAEEELGRRIGQLSPLSQINPFQAYLGGQLSF